MKIKPELGNIRNIAVIRTDRIGEVLLSTPVVEALKKHFPHARISFTTSPYSMDIVSGRPDIAEVITFNTIDRKIPFWEAIPLSLTLRKKGFDMAVVLNPHKVLHLAVFLAGIRFRIGFDRKWAVFLNFKAKDRRGHAGMHEVDYNLELLESIGIKENGIPPFFNVSKTDSYYISSLFKQFNITPDRKVIVIHPGTSNPAKRWPVENFIELIKKLLADNNFNIILIADRNEKDLCKDITTSVSKNSIINLAGLLTLKQLGALFKASDLLITNDNGPMHIAAACGTKVIALFNKNLGGSNPFRWGPYGQGHTIFYKPIDEIKPSEIYEAAIKNLNR